MLCGLFLMQKHGGLVHLNTHRRAFESRAWLVPECVCVLVGGGRGTADTEGGVFLLCPFTLSRPAGIKREEM